MRTIGVLVGIVILLAALKAASSIVVPLLVAGLIALAFQPIAERLAAKGVPAIVAAIITIVCVLGSIAAVGYVIGLAAADLAVSAPRYGEELSRLRDDFVKWLDQRDMEVAVDEIEIADTGLDPGALVRRAVGILSGLLGALTQVLFLTAFIQLEATMMKRKLEVILAGTRSLEHVMEAVTEAQRYLRVKALLSFANGVLLGLWCWLWGVSNPLLWGVLAFALNFVPIIGSLIAAIPPVLLAIVELGLGGAIGVTAGYVAVNLLVDNMLEPRLMGRTMGLSPLVLMVSLLVWGFVLGPVGALVSVPLTVAVRIYFEYHPDLRWIGLLLAASPRQYGDLIRRARALPPPP